MSSQPLPTAIAWSRDPPGGSWGNVGVVFLLIGLKAHHLWEEGEPGAGDTVFGGAVFLVMALALLIWVL